MREDLALVASVFVVWLALVGVNVSLVKARSRQDLTEMSSSRGNHVCQCGWLASQTLTVMAKPVRGGEPVVAALTAAEEGKEEAERPACHDETFAQLRISLTPISGKRSRLQAAQTTSGLPATKTGLRPVRHEPSTCEISLTP